MPTHIGTNQAGPGSPTLSVAWPGGAINDGLLIGITWQNGSSNPADALTSLRFDGLPIPISQLGDWQQIAFQTSASRHGVLFAKQIGPFETGTTTVDLTNADIGGAAINATIFVQTWSNVRAGRFWEPLAPTTNTGTSTTPTSPVGGYTTTQANSIVGRWGFNERSTWLTGFASMTCPVPASCILSLGGPAGTAGAQHVSYTPVVPLAGTNIPQEAGSISGSRPWTVVDYEIVDVGAPAAASDLQLAREYIEAGVDNFTSGVEEQLARHYIEVALATCPNITQCCSNDPTPPVVAPTLVGSAGAAANSIAVPGVINIGDLIIVGWESEQNSGGVFPTLEAKFDLDGTTFTGWTPLVFDFAGGPVDEKCLMAKIATATEAGTATLNYTGTAVGGDIAIAVFSGVAGLPTVTVTTGTVDANPTAPAAVTSQDNSYVFQWTAINDNRAYTVDPGSPMGTWGAALQGHRTFDNGLIALGGTAIPATPWTQDAAGEWAGATVEVLGITGAPPACDQNFTTGGSIFIEGTDFGAVQGASTVDYYAAGDCGGAILGTLAVVSWSDTLIEATLPGSFGAGIDVGINTFLPACLTVCCASIGVQACPECTSITPDPIFPGTLVSINGTAFGAVQGTQEIRIYDNGCDFGPYALATPTFWSDTLVQFIMPNLTVFGILHIAVVQP